MAGVGRGEVSSNAVGGGNGFVDGPYHSLCSHMGLFVFQLLSQVLSLSGK